MTSTQEDALYDFLENVTEPFTLEDMAAVVQLMSTYEMPLFHKERWLSPEIAALINSRNLAFKLDNERWISRRGCFEPLRFVITPSRLEIQNGIFIPGHRCVPFANPALMPHELKFYWKRRRIPVTTTEGPPEDFYPFYSIFGEEYAPQYIAKDNPENEKAYNSDPFEDPAEVSIHTLDMRGLYRETAFVPGDRFVVRSRNWKAGAFELEKVDKDAWSREELRAWFEAAETGFHESFERLGPGFSIDEQISYAYWYGGRRIRETPAYSLEEYLYERTETIEIAAYGIETRFWFTGREIPDMDSLDDGRTFGDSTYIEELLRRAGAPVSEYAVRSYVRDALFRNDAVPRRIVERIIPPAVETDKRTQNALLKYIRETLAEFKISYNIFTDKAMGPIRQRAGELHTAVIDLSLRLLHDGADSSWFPRHTFIVLSQIQSNSAMILEDLETAEPLPASELAALDNSLDGMIETYEDIKELIDEALNSFRRSNLSVVKKAAPGPSRQNGVETLQLSLGGTDIWRRIVLPASCRLSVLHRIIQILFGWDNGDSNCKTDDADDTDGGANAGGKRPGREQAASSPPALRLYRDSPARYRYSVARAAGARRHGLTDKPPLPTDSLDDLRERGVNELVYECGNLWTVKILFFGGDGDTVIVFPGRAGNAAPVRCVAGEGASPPAFLDGPLRFRKFLAARERGNPDGYDPAVFDPAELNRRLAALSLTAGG